MTLRRTVLASALCLITACGGSDNSDSHSSTPTTSSGVGVLVYQDSTPTDTENRFRWYKVDGYGERSLLDDVSVPSGFDLTGDQLSPDGRRLAYWYVSADGQSSLGIVQIDSPQAQPHRIVLDGIVASPVSWLPDSSGIVFTIRSEMNTHTLLLARAGEANPVQLFAATPLMQYELRYALSADGARVAVEFPAGNGAGNQTSLHVVAINQPEAATLLDSAQTDAGSVARFSFAWSPYSGDLMYQGHAPGGSPLVLYRENGTRQELGTPANAVVSWLAADRLLVDFDTSVAIIDTQGVALGSHAVRPGGRRAHSPDGGHLAVLADGENGEVQVLVIAVDSGQGRLVGRGSSFSQVGFVPLPNIDSELRWSPDGSWLAWNRFLDTDGLTDYQQGELYAYEVATDATRLVSPSLGSAAPLNPLSHVTWLPTGNVLNYLVRGDDGYQLTVQELASDDTVVAGNTPGANCWLLRAWPTNDQLLWNRCGGGVYLSTIDAGGTVAVTRQRDGDIASLSLAAGGEVAVMQSVAPEDGMAGVSRNWQLYNFAEQQFYEIDGTSAIPCCGSLTP